MYKLMVNGDRLPAVVSTNSQDYADMLQLGYTELFSGTKKQCEDMKEEMVGEFAG